jgi:hypothetical protein
MNPIQNLKQWLPETITKSVERSLQSAPCEEQDIEKTVKKLATTYIRDTLHLHFKKKISNAPWLQGCLDGKPEDFPHSIAVNGVGNILYNSIVYPSHQNNRDPAPLKKKTPRFVVNIPDGRSPSVKPSDIRYDSIIRRLVNESFSTTAGGSSRMIKSRVAIVIGTNQIESLDQDFNDAFVKMIQNTHFSQDAPSRRVGFLWRPQYQSDHKPHLYPPRKSFYLLKMLNPTRAKEVQSRVEQPNGKLHPNILKQIPFQKIRELILKSNQTREFADAFVQTAPSSPIYLTVMDADFHTLLSSDGKGLFEKILEVTPANNPLSVIGTSYSAMQFELPIICLAVKIDMAVRVAMSRLIPYSAYLPEPFLCALLRKPNHHHHIAQLSFIGNGQALESRRLIENGRARGVFDDRMTFLPDGPVTSSPERWKTVKNKSKISLAKNEIKQKRILQALRGLSQSHAHPKKWADQVYSAIDYSCAQVTDATGPMMHIFNVFDPISRMFARGGRFTCRNVDKEISNFNDPLSVAQTSILNSSIAKLIQLGMTRKMIDKVILAAQASGTAIHSELSKAIA